MKNMVEKIGIVMVLVLAGCDGMEPNANDPDVTETVVELHEDGRPPEITVNRVADISYGKCYLINYHSPPMFIYDAAGNSACFWGTGSVDLNTVPRAGGNTWWMATVSYAQGSWSGYFSGLLYYNYRFHPCTESFTASRTGKFAGVCTQNSTYLTLTSQTYLP
jgi:hypothetical protein